MRDVMPFSEGKSEKGSQIEDLMPFSEGKSKKGSQIEDLMPFSEGKSKKGSQIEEVMPFSEGRSEKGNQQVFHNLLPITFYRFLVLSRHSITKMRRPPNREPPPYSS